MLHKLNDIEIAFYTNPEGADDDEGFQDEMEIDDNDEIPYIKKDFCCFQITNLPRISASRKMNFEAGGKIILPEKALLLSLDHGNFSGEPLLFRLTHKDRSTHCGVLEFTAKEESILMPRWMMENIQVKDGNIVTVESVELPKATSVILKASEEFLQRYDPKPTLEARFVHFTCLTEGDKLKVHVNGGVHEMTVIETQPDSAVCIVDCDLNVEFERPAPFSQGSGSRSRLDTQIGIGRRLDGKQVAEADNHMEIDDEVREKGRGAIPDLAFSPGNITFDRGTDANNIIEQDEKMDVD